MDFTEIRKTVIQAAFSDDVLMNRLVLKGGAALEIVLGVVSRGSIDVDFSIENDFEDIQEIKRRLFMALQDRFDAHDVIVFDTTFEERPPEITDDAMPWWGGYRASFKILPRERADMLASRPQKAQVEALPIAEGQLRTFKIDISKHESCSVRHEAELDGFTIYSYTPSMLVIEKLRAICQQMPDYHVLQRKRPRARDFYDIHAITTKLHVDLARTESQAMCEAIFEAKRVPIRLLTRIRDRDVREYHRLDWERVKNSVVGEVPGEFDFYFDFVVRQASKLESLWKE